MMHHRIVYRRHHCGADLIFLAEQLYAYQEMMLNKILLGVTQKISSSGDIIEPRGLYPNNVRSYGLRPKTIIIDDFKHQQVSSMMSQVELDVIFDRKQLRTEYISNELDMKRAEERKKYETEILRQFRRVNERYYKKP